MEGGSGWGVKILLHNTDVCNQTLQSKKDARKKMFKTKKPKQYLQYWVRSAGSCMRPGDPWMLPLQKSGRNNDFAILSFIGWSKIIFNSQSYYIFQKNETALTQKSIISYAEKSDCFESLIWDIPWLCLLCCKAVVTARKVELDRQNKTITSPTETCSSP